VAFAFITVAENGRRNKDLDASFAGEEMNSTEFQSVYETKGDDELLRLAVHLDELTPEAREALSVELARRKLSTSDVEELISEDVSHAKEEAKKIGTLFVAYNGIGRQRYGKANRTFDTQTKLEQFTTTVFFVLFWIPLVPVGTYRVQKTKGWASDDLRVLERLPLNWEQVLTIWVVTAAIMLASLWIMKLLFWYTVR
jgi:hypothetical protein